MSVESMATDPYEVVLNDLRAKKAQIEQAISAIEAMRGGTPSGSYLTAASVAPTGQNSDIDSPGAFLGMSIVDAAKKLLAAKRQPLRNPDIAAAFKRGGLAMNSKDAVNTIGSVLTRRANDVGDLVKVDRGTWGLKEWYPNRSFKKGVPVEKGEVVARPLLSDEEFLGDSRMLSLDQLAKLKAAGMTEEELRAMPKDEADQYLDLLS
ncbi:winged helix-turn-helix domain-containing protein [Mesorhizobium sp. LNJC403B00]|uniref:winged helix-turn-helix domain-containing protein n=1 Tax=Mesorhizobium sp. LNJC403B00 TaxID=1287280 RepID=UPI000A07998F|nr:winged helix-turn-helix domain-containing protein [Mesorhizobium sp. LNJC403B00]